MNSQFANRNGPLIHGKDAQFLVEKITREKIFESLFWKEHCFSLDLYGLIEKTISKCQYIGGICGTTRPAPFLCLTLKLLQLRPELDVVLEMLKFPQFKYLKCLALFYTRLTQDSKQVYQILEPFLNDYSRLRMQLEDGTFTLIHMDEFVDQLLSQERVCGIILSRLTKRKVLENNLVLEPNVSIIEYELQELLYSTQQNNQQTQENSASTKQTGKLSFKTKPSTVDHDFVDPSLAIIAAKRAEKEEVNASLSLEATNELRRQRDLKPLKI